jgi:outer membrane protein assembly factor BamB
MELKLSFPKNKKANMIRLMIVALFLANSTILVQAEEWGHWRGPTGNGVSLQASPPTQWSEQQNIRWKTKIPGRSSGSPVVWGDQVFVVTSVPTQNGKLSFQLHSYDRASGKQNWQQTAVEAKPLEPTHSTNTYASASPCTDGKYVFAHFGSRGLYCYTMKGEFVWKRDFGIMKTRNGFGEGSSPTLVDDMIIVPWDHEGQSILFALDKATGKSIWETKRDEPTCWSTPLVVEHAGKRQVIMNGETKARAYDLATGRELWQCAGQTERPCASPCAANGLVYIGSGHRGSFLGAFNMNGKGDIAKSKNVVWTINKDTPDVASPILSNGRLYFYKGKSGQLSCVDAATGKPFYTAARIPGVNSTYASPVAAGGYIYLTDRNGTITVIADAPELKVIATNSMNEPVDATPAPVGKQLFVRGEQHLFCLSE